MKYFEKIKKILDLMSQANLYKNPVSQFFDIIKHKLMINTSPYDYYRYKFYIPGKTFSEKSLFIGFDGSKYYPYDLNLVQFTPLLDNKFIFKTIISGLSLPQAKLISTIGKRYHIVDGESFANLMSHIDYDVVFKPVQGAEGQGVFVVEVKSGKFYINGQSQTIGDIWNLVDNGKSNYLIEHKICQSKAFNEIYSHSLNTFRIVTLKVETGWEVIFSLLRIGQKGSVVDNADAGGILVHFDNEGLSRYVYDCTQSTFIERHPDTDYLLTGKNFPGYDEAILLALRASKALSILGTVGWDIGISEEGPVIVEANVFYGCTFPQMITGEPFLTEDIAKQLKTHSFWQKWDKTRLRPKMKGDIIG